jgi:hypothetical protein
MSNRDTKFLLATSTITWLAGELALLLGLALLLMPTATALAQIVPPEQVKPNNPNGMYGGCNHPDAGVRRKIDHVKEAGQDVTKVTAISVLDCHRFDGPGATHVVQCPAHTDFTYCLLNQNDGVGNHILLGVKTREVEPECKVAAKRAGPPAQIDIVIQDPTGVVVIGFTGGVTNAETQPYAVGNDRKPIIITATKIDQTEPASLGSRPPTQPTQKPTAISRSSTAAGV